MHGVSLNRRSCRSRCLTAAVASAALIMGPSAAVWADDQADDIAKEWRITDRLAAAPNGLVLGQAEAGGGAVGGGAAAGAGAGIGTTGLVVAGAVIVGGAAMAAAASGGGGGSSDGGSSAASSEPEPFVDPATPAAIESFRTAEYLRHGGYDRVNLAHAYARGYTGDGQIIAILDDGFQLDHPAFAGQIATSFPSAQNMTAKEHGTHVAGIAAAARDGEGMHGAAFNARLALYGFDFSPAQATDRFDRASAADAVVINNSWGIETPVADVRAAIEGGATIVDALHTVAGSGTPTQWREFLNSMVAAQDNGAVIVFAASNDAGLGSIDISAGMPLIDDRLLGRWLAVVNVDARDRIDSIGCGEARAFCLAAPGVNVTSALPVNNIGPDTGTSMAAPLVSGAVALVVEAFGLSPGEAVSRLLTTADRSFDGYALDDHGQGILDMETATRPIGRLRVQPEGSVHRAGGPDLATTSFLTSRAFGDSMSRAFTGTPIAAFDDGGAAFLFDLGSLVSDQGPASTAIDTLLALGVSPDRQRFDMPGIGTLSLTMRPKAGQTQRPSAAERHGTAGYRHGDGDKSEEGLANFMGAAFETDLSAGRMHVGFHQSAEDLLTRIAPDAAGDVFGHAPGLFAAPYPGFAQQGYSLGFDYPMSETATFSLVSFAGEGGDDTPFKGFGTQATVAFAPANGIGLSFDGGALIENDTLMGSSAEGAFAFGGGARTVYAGVRAEAQLDDQWSLVGNYHHGWTAMDGFESPMIRSIDGVETQAFAAGIVGRDLAAENDRFGFAVSQPIRVEAGQASFTVPVWRDWSGAIQTTRRDVDLAPSGRELRFEATYGFDLPTNGRITALAMHRFDADHVAGRQDTTAMLRLRQPF